MTRKKNNEPVEVVPENITVNETEPVEAMPENTTVDEDADASAEHINSSEYSCEKGCKHVQVFPHDITSYTY